MFSLTLRKRLTVNRVWHAALWTIMRQYNIGNNLIHVIQRLYERATSAVFINDNIGEWFHTRVGVRQWCIIIIPYTLQHLPREDYVRCAWRTRRNSQHSSTNHHQFKIRWWHRWPGRQWTRTRITCWAHWPNIKSLRHGDKCWTNKTND